MPQFTDLTGLLGAASVVSAIAMTLPGLTRLSAAHKGILLSLVFILTLIPFGELPLAAYVRGATGDLSIPSLLLLWIGLINAMCPTIQNKPFALSLLKGRNELLMLIAITALVFYPLSLGIGMFDPYRYGFGCVTFIFALLVIALAAWARESGLIVLCLALASLAWSIGWYESNNLLDYLIDPFLAIYALGVITFSMKKHFSKRPLKET